jgi:hypothetical protein
MALDEFRCKGKDQLGCLISAQCLSKAIFEMESLRIQPLTAGSTRAPDSFPGAFSVEY